MKRERLLSFFIMILDAVVVYFSYYIWYRIGIVLGFQYTERNLLALNAFVPYILIAYILVFFIYQLYKVNEIDFYETFLGIFISCFIILILGFALSFFLRAFAVPRTVVIYSFLIQIVLLVLSHWIVGRIYEKVNPPLKTLIISKDGNNAAAVKTYVEDIKAGRRSVEVMLLSGKEFSKHLKEVISVFNVFIIDDSFTVEEKSELLKFFAYNDKPVFVLPGIYELLILKPRTHLIKDLTLLEMNLVNISGVERIIKRAFDIVFSFIAIVFFSPVLMAVSIAILLESGKPIFYLQERAGANGRVLKTIKFRTMIKDAEKYTGAVLSSENDTRITKVGRFLRKTGLDEIPQFFNVLNGEMSVVGPRPERPELMAEIKKEAPDFDLRLKVKPGITGYAQLYGKYDTPFEKKLKMDLLYVKQKNTILTDLYIIFNTVKLFLTPHKRK